MLQRFWAFGIGLSGIVAIPIACAQSAADYAVRLSAAVQASPARIVLSWPGDPRATGYTVSRKTRDAQSWGIPTSLSATATNYTDSNVSTGSAYEYRVIKTAPTGTSNYTAHSYLYAGINVPLVDSRGKVLLIVEQSLAATLAMPLARLQYDLAGDGWTVLRRDVPGTSSVQSLRNQVIADYQADPNRLKAVFLLGHLPVAYSGNYAPDGHEEHRGAWPADACFGDVNGTWSDTVISNTAASSPRTRNVPGDGKFDQSYISSDVELQVGRVDLSDLPAFSASEASLLAQYLEKDHNFRHAYTQAERRGIIDDNFGAFDGEAFAANGWRAFAPMFGAAGTSSGNWTTTLQTQSFLCGYGCGAGTYTSASGVITTAQLAASDPRVVFAFLFGSWFGDWDSRDNLLRASLATPGYTLASAWAGRPYWILHHAALGETLGFCTRITQNNFSLYSSNLMPNTVHIALMGDPTLRLHAVAPPRSLTVSPRASGGSNLQWSPSLDPDVLGYHVYRAASAAGPFTRLTSSLLSATVYSSGYSSGVFMVRAVKLEQSASGSYYNASQGILQNLAGSVGKADITLTSPPQGKTYLAPASVPMAASVLSAANGVTNVAFYANGAVVAEVVVPPFHTSWSNALVGEYEVYARAFSIDGTVTNSTPVTIRMDNGGSPTLGITPARDGGFTVHGREALGRTYIVEYTEDLGVADWQLLGIVTNTTPGPFEITDPDYSRQRFYRTRTR